MRGADDLFAPYTASLIRDWLPLSSHRAFGWMLHDQLPRSGYSCPGILLLAQRGHWPNLG